MNHSIVHISDGSSINSSSVLKQPVDFNLMPDDLIDIERNTVLPIAGNTDFTFNEKSE